MCCFSEFGLPTHRRNLASEEAVPATDTTSLIEEVEAAEYVGRVLTGLRDAGATGAMLWCYSDYDAATFGRPPMDVATHERSFGLWRADATPKPAVDVVRAFAGSTRLAAPETEPWIDIEPDRYRAAPGAELPRLYERYLRASDPTGDA